MKTDIKRITEVTREMKLNDIVYNRMRDELNEYIDLIVDLYHEELAERFEELYFYQRVLSVLSNYDLPLKAAIGYFDLLDCLETLFDVKENHIGDSDSDADIFKFVVEFGYELYDDIIIPGEDTDDVYNRMWDNYELYMRGDI